MAAARRQRPSGQQPRSHLDRRVLARLPAAKLSDRLPSKALARLQRPRRSRRVARSVEAARQQQHVLGLALGQGHELVRVPHCCREALRLQRVLHQQAQPLQPASLGRLGRLRLMHLKSAEAHFTFALRDRRRGALLRKPTPVLRARDHSQGLHASRFARLVC